MYGTIARMKVKRENLDALRAWAAEARTRNVPGFRSAHVLLPDAWNDEVLHPIAPADSAAETVAAFARAAQVARALGGAPRAAAAGHADAPALIEVPPAGTSAPQVAAPKLSAMPAGKAPVAKKKKEGC